MICFVVFIGGMSQSLPKCLQMKSNSIELLGTYCLFVGVGEYPDYSSGIPHFNHPLCGIGNASGVYVISFNKKCFGKEYKNKTIVDISTEPHFDGEEGEVLSRVFKGRNAKKGEAPWVVYIHIQTVKKQSMLGTEYEYASCTGTLLTFEWVITSAHCVKDR